MVRHFSLYSSLFLFISFCFLGLLNPAGVHGDEQSGSLRLEKAMGMYKKYQDKFEGIGDIAPQAAVTLLGESNVVFLDIRSKDEQRVSMIPGALTKKQFLNTLEDHSGKKIIAYCTIGYRSGKFAQKMKRKGIDVLNLQAGILGWVHAGGKVIHDEQEVRRIHVYGKTWDLAPSSVETTY